MASNEATRLQFQNFFDNAVKNRNNPNNKEKIKQNRMKKAQKVSKTYGF